MMYIFTYLFYLFHNIIDYFYIGYCEDTQDKKDDIEIIQLTQEPVITYDVLINHNSLEQEDSKKILMNEINDENNWELI